MWAMVCFIGTILQHGQGHHGPVSLPGHPHLCAVWLRRSLLSPPHVPYHSLYTHAPTHSSYSQRYATDGLLSSRRSYLYEHGHITNSCEHHAHNQGTRPLHCDIP